MFYFQAIQHVYFLDSVTYINSVQLETDHQEYIYS